MYWKGNYCNERCTSVLEAVLVFHGHQCTGKCTSILVYLKGYDCTEAGARLQVGVHCTGRGTSTLERVPVY